MIANQRKFSLLPDLDMPIRDALRGVASLADATEDMLEPAARLLPEPLRSRFHHAMQTLEQAGKRLIHAPIDMAKIATASRFVDGTFSDKPSVSAAASVIAYAWEHLNQTHVEHHHLISETIVAERLSRLGAAGLEPGLGFTATVFLDLRQSSAIGFLPGLSRGLTKEEETEVDLALGAIAVWMASTRADNLDEEEKLLDLSMALVRALQSDAIGVLEDRDALTVFLDKTASHL